MTPATKDATKARKGRNICKPSASNGRSTHLRAGSTARTSTSQALRTGSACSLLMPKLRGRRASGRWPPSSTSLAPSLRLRRAPPNSSARCSRPSSRPRVRKKLKVHRRRRSGRRRHQEASLTPPNARPRFIHKKCQCPFPCDATPPAWHCHRVAGATGADLRSLKHGRSRVRARARMRGLFLMCPSKDEYRTIG